jgi:hypothetical protein
MMYLKIGLYGGWVMVEIFRFGVPNGFQLQFPFSIQTACRGFVADVRAIELIDQDTKWWNTRLIHDNFS